VSCRKIRYGEIHIRMYRPFTNPSDTKPCISHWNLERRLRTFSIIVSRGLHWKVIPEKSELKLESIANHEVHVTMSLSTNRSKGTITIYSPSRYQGVLHKDKPSTSGEIRNFRTTVRTNPCCSGCRCRLFPRTVKIRPSNSIEEAKEYILVAQFPRRCSSPVTNSDGIVTRNLPSVPILCTRFTPRISQRGTARTILRIPSISLLFPWENHVSEIFSDCQLRSDVPWTSTIPRRGHRKAPRQFPVAGMKPFSMLLAVL
jgi:hypothetical protein